MGRCTHTGRMEPGLCPEASRGVQHGPFWSCTQALAAGAARLHEGDTCAQTHICMYAHLHKYPQDPASPCEKGGIGHRRAALSLLVSEGHALDPPVPPPLVAVLSLPGKRGFVFMG